METKSNKIKHFILIFEWVKGRKLIVTFCASMLISISVIETICQIIIRFNSSILSKHVGLLLVVLVYKLFWTQVCFRAADPNLWYTSFFEKVQLKNYQVVRKNSF